MKSRHFLLSYAPHRMDPVSIVAYVPGNFVHFRLVLYPQAKDSLESESFSRLQSKDVR